MTARVTSDPGGRWLAVVGGSGALLVDGGPERADALLTALGAADPVEAVLEVLAGAGLGDVPGFALVATDASGNPRHAVVRGAAVVRADGRELTGQGARTWLEHELDGACVELAAPGVEAGTALPLERGAVFGTRIELTGGATPAAAPRAESVVPSEPSPASVPAPEPVVVAAPVAVPAPPPALAPAPTPVPEHTMVEPEEGGFGYDRLFESTIIRPVEDAAMRPAVDEEEEPAPDAPPAPSDLVSASPAPQDPADDGDHDGETVLSGTIPGRSERPRPAAHEIAAAAATRRFALVLPGDRREPIDGELILGRAPTARVVDGRMPRLVPLEGDPDVSRSHVRIALEGDTVVVTDLRSRNGTNVVLPGKPPQLLRADEPTPVIPGTVVDLGATKLVVEEQLDGAGA
ncbi:FHA domain-containing protein [Pseudolysinimonas sp.]|uniref:FHA domain-containing protein n=1 Tax=Pseudolysinimonas sp. TaxID=2680009 RepID=UPI003F7FD566